MAVYRVCIRCDGIGVTAEGRAGTWGFFKNEYIWARSREDAVLIASNRVRRALTIAAGADKEAARTVPLSVEEVEAGKGILWLLRKEGFVSFDPESPMSASGTTEGDGSAGGGQTPKQGVLSGYPRASRDRRTWRNGPRKAAVRDERGDNSLCRRHRVAPFCSFQGTFSGADGRLPRTGTAERVGSVAHRRGTQPVRIPSQASKRRGALRLIVTPVHAMAGVSPSRDC